MVSMIPQGVLQLKTGISRYPQAPGLGLRLIRLFSAEKWRNFEKVRRVAVRRDKTGTGLRQVLVRIIFGALYW